MSVQLINPFVVPADKEEEFLKAWKETTQIFSTNPGFIETYLHKNIGVGDSMFLYINVAIWESAEAWDSSHGSYKPKEESIPGVEHHPGIFEEAIHVKGTHKAK
jgi:heme-degrading monooxygenase HmoA